MKNMLEVGASSYVGEYLLPQVISEWEHQSSDTDLSIEISDTQRVFEKVLSGELDAGFIAACLEDEAVETAEIVTHDELVFCVPCNHPLAKKKEISVQDLKGQEFISREPGSATRMWYRERLSSEGLSFNDMNIVAELGSQRAVLSAVEAGAGVSFLPRRVAQDSLDRGTVCEVAIRNITPLYGNIYAIWSTSRPLRRELSHFINFIQNNRHLMSKEGQAKQLTAVKEPAA